MSPPFEAVLLAVLLAAPRVIPVADALFNRINAEIYCLEYDTPRAGDFSPLRFVPKNKTVILGLVSTKTPKPETKAELKQRNDEADRSAAPGALGAPRPAARSRGKEGGAAGAAAGGARSSANGSRGSGGRPRRPFRGG